MAKKRPKHNPKKINPPGKYHGGKAYLCRRLIELHPPAEKYNKHVEPFGGLASVKLNLPVATRESPRVDIYNDIDGRLYNLFDTLQKEPRRLQELLALTPYSEEMFEDACNEHIYRISSFTEQARMMFVRLQMSLGGRGESFSRTKSRTRRGIADCVSGYLSKIHKDLPEIAEAVTEWQLEKRDGLECIKYHDSPTTMFYLDPPYLPETRTSADVYVNEMTPEQHEELLQYKGEFRP
ncbi:unnamed protein product, partial [marine sediment metagenome]